MRPMRGRGRPGYSLLSKRDVLSEASVAIETQKDIHLWAADIASWEDLPGFPEPDDGAPVNISYEHHMEKPAPRQKKYPGSDRPLMDWVLCRQEYLDSLLFLEGRGEALVVTGCPLCWEPGVWTGQMFEHASLRGLGLTVQLGHLAYQKCPVPVYASSSFIVIHMNGVHSIRVTFCGCSNAPHHRVQLLRRRWFPSTVLQPKSCATFKVLHQYHLLSLSSKISIHHFYDMLERLTNNTGLVPVPNKYKSFCRMVREWRHLKMLKQAGRGNDPSGMLGTASGELAVICPACPEPGVNLPEEWMNTPEEERFLYDGIYAINANFHLKNRVRSSVDPGLGTGWAYFVDDQAYSMYLLKHTSQKDISSCAAFAALDHANTKKSDGLRVTGVGAIVCAHHGLLRPNGIGDLQKGERTKEMGSGCRHDTLDDIWSDLNYRKITTLGTSLLQKLHNALVQSAFHLEQYDTLTQGLADDDASTWERMVREWEIDASKPDPYTLPLSNKSQVQIRLELIEMERDSLYHGSVSLHDVSASAFVIMGLDIEDTQWKLTSDVQCMTETISSLTSIESQQLSLVKRIKTFRNIQRIYMPEACRFLTSEDECEKPSHPETIKLFLPSQIPAEYRVQNTIVDIEVKLRVGQAFDALSSLRSSLCIRAHLTNYKQTVRGQHMHTHAMALIESAKRKTASIATKYTVSCQTLISLVGLDGIDPQLKELRDRDVRTLSDPEISEDKQDSHTQNLGEGSRVLSWIWISAGEWMKLRARKERWREEVLLLCEEMRRVLAFCEHREAWWIDLSHSQTSLSLPQLEGNKAYTLRQASLQQSRQKHFQSLWNNILSSPQDQVLRELEEKHKNKSLSSGVIENDEDKLLSDDGLDPDK
ncbi:hypothetical protein BS47DRAFT_1401750 [Hydnum rufescens UP504]|uniref:CxC2-like cysteine cluster KDZ transposase-associated domain-containing protein n=1 Tax=Hydnum rufescens UP504 TaxID=1448309 RepID=A0A9P6AE79_9AGAM|nr:hypothetical protein BS47DRAFT_1401750 [Hydnum rufescens UP504]